MNHRLSLAALLLLVSASVFADDNATQQEPIIVTATRTAQTADETLASVTVITRDQIDHSQAQSVQDLLVGVPGLEISNSGGPGKATSVFLRGTNSDHVLVLIDGVKVGSATLGTTAFENIPVAQIDRIEIVRGPRSSLYGSEAIGGVIQIFTRHGGGPLTPYFSLGGGTYKTYQGAAGVSGGDDHGWFSANLSGINTSGFNACNGPGGCFTVEPDKDGYRNVSGALRAGYRFDNGADVDAHWLRAKGFNKYDGSFSNEAQPVQDVLGGRVGFSPTAPWRVSLAAGRSRDNSDDFLNGAFVDRFNTRRDSVSLQNDINFASAHLVTLGLDYQNDHIDSTTTYTVTSRDDKGIFVQYQGTFGMQDLQASLRRDANAQFGGYTTGGLAWGHTFSNQLRLTSSYGTAFKAPTFNELYYPGFGNPALKPEDSQSAELGLSGKYGLGHWSVNVYQTDINRLIGFDANFNPVNIDSARLRGLEAVVATRFLGCELNTNLTLLDPENRSDGANHSNILPRRAKQQLRIDLDRSLGRYRFGTTLFAAGKRYDDLANTQPLAGYATVDLRAEYAFTPDWSLQTRVGNLFDRNYETAAFFNQAGRALYVTLRYQPTRTPTHGGNNQ